MLTLIKSTELPSWITRVATGEVVRVRSANENDVDGLQRYFRSLSRPSRRDRFMGGITDLSAHEVARMTSQDGVPSFMIVAEIDGDGSERIVGEAYCALDIADQQGEFAVSVRDRWQRRGIGFALLAAVESCADRFGLKGLFGETMQSNDRMRNLAVRAGFVVGRCPGDWSVSRLEKRLQVASQMPDDPPAPGSAHSLLSRNSAAPCNPFKAV